MRILRLFLPVCLLLIGASAALADGAPDPENNHGRAWQLSNPLTRTSETQSFTVATGCLVDFTNLITNDSDTPNVTLDLLVVNVMSNFVGELSCEAGEGDAPAIRRSLSLSEFVQYFRM